MWKIVLTTFGVMFLAEIGDKTQLAVIALSSRYRSPWAVFAGAALAMVAATAVGVVIGRFVPVLFGENVVRIVSGGLLVLFGVLILLGR
jgi:putative Ca2+/H+ antiporter (TMEM165/GDT1 family)